MAGTLKSLLSVVALVLIALSSRPSHAEDQPLIFFLPDTLRIVGDRITLDPLRVPMATTVVTATEWSDAKTLGLDEPLSYVPGVLAQSRAGSNDVRITMRGFGARGAGERSNSGTTRGIRITLDGFPLTEPDGRTSLDFADAGLLERIRVIRSNSSTLFGPASGGLIDLQTITRFERSYGDVRTEFGSHDYARQTVESGFASQTTSVRLVGSTDKYSGFRDHGSGSQSTVLASILSEPSPANSLGIFFAGTHNLQRQPGALTQAEIAADPTQADPSYVSQDARRDNRILRLGAKLDHRFSGGQVMKVGLFVEPKTIQRSERNRYRDFQRMHTGGSAAVTTGAASGRLTLSAGVDEAWQDGSVLFYNLVNGSRGTTLIADQREGINTLGVFTEAEYTPAPKWKGTVGVRWDDVYYVSENHQEPALNAKRSLDRVSPRVSLSYRLDADRMFYAAMNGGIETPAFNEVDPPAPFDTLTSLNSLLEPSTSLTFEVGAKGEGSLGFGVDRYSYDVALYTLEVRNDIIPWDGGAYYMTAGKSRRTGLEVGVTGATSYGLSTRLAGTVSRNRYLDYETGAPGEDGRLVTVRYDDNETAGIPSAFLQGSLRYDHPRGAFGQIEVRRVGKYWANDANTNRVDAYTLLDVTVGGDLHLGGATLGAFVSGRNLTDETYAASVFINGANGRYLEPGMGRNLLAGVTLKTASR